MKPTGQQLPGASGQTLTADTQDSAEQATWTANGEMVRAINTRLKNGVEDEDDWDQTGALIREILDDDGRDRLVTNVVKHLKSEASKSVLDRVIEYWRKADQEIGGRIAEHMNND